LSGVIFSESELALIKVKGAGPQHASGKAVEWQETSRTEVNCSPSGC